ncbi:C2H2 transcription factor-like protein [Halenospora varia]|nr:C2H2 transcription factor-like protein [Halenospora varia]
MYNFHGRDERIGSVGPSAEPPRFPCSSCSQTFGRVEHLTRHARSHMPDRMLKCPRCSKGFYRVDALRRHEQVHDEAKRSLRGKGARACYPCATARRKCSGGSTCTGCERRGIQCVYPNTSRISKDELTTSSTGKGSTGLGPGNLAGASDHGSPMSCSSTLSSPRANIQKEPEMDVSVEGTSISQPQFTSQENAAHDNGSSPSLRRESRMDATAPLEHAYNGEGDPRQYQHAEPMDPSGLVNQPVMDYATPLDSTEPQRTLDHVLLQNPQDISDSWFEGNMSSINWLPYDWTPDLQVGIGNSLHSAENLSTIHTHNPHVASTSFETTGQDHFRPYNLAKGGNTQNYHPNVRTELGDGLSMSSPGSLSTQSGGQYYVNGDGARLPRVKKAPYQFGDMDVAPDAIETRGTPFAFPETDESIISHSHTSRLETIRPSVYNDIYKAFELTCLTYALHSAFSSRSFPSIQTLGHFVSLYIENFQGIFPCVHPASLDLSNIHWLFVLALAAIGSHYVDTKDFTHYAIPMHEFLRRAIQMLPENDFSRPDRLRMTQIKLFNCIGMMYCGDVGLLELAKGHHADLVGFCDQDWKVYSVVGEEKSWNSWHKKESYRRTGYCIWLLDCMLVFHFQTRPLLALEDAGAPIPCQEVIWEAKTAMDWEQLYGVAIQSPSLQTTLQRLYVEKTIPSSTGEFSRILCIHALFKRTWEVENYLSQPLALWDPTVERQDMRAIESSGPVWLPDIPTYSKWRNSACDCLDVLHWHANSVIGAASGMEHPTVLHLHLARIILLTPFRKIVELANLMTDGSATRNVSKIASLKKHIHRWATEDQYKARLAMIHAGVLFWHVRRYSVDAFYEPSSVYLATLALWAYGRFAAHTSGLNNNAEGESPHNDDEDAESLFPTSMQLDRPADDELVQLFVKRGTMMRANIMGVGNLCSAKGYVRVLVEGKRLLRGLKKWGSGRSSMRTLDMLVEVCQQEAIL